MRTSFDNDAIRSALDGLDHLAATLERKWGIGRLRLVVDDELRSRFDRQAMLLDKFLWDHSADAAATVAKIHAMRRGWEALDQAATSAGVQVVPPRWLECPLEAGGVAVLVADPADASAVRAQTAGRCIAVYSVQEIGRMIDAAAGILVAKIEFPGAMVEQIRVKRPKDVDLNDPIIPFN